MALEIMEKTSLERDMDKIKTMIENADTELLSYQESDFDSKEAKSKLIELLNDGVKRENGVPFLKELLSQLERKNAKFKKIKEKGNDEITDTLLTNEKETPELIKNRILSFLDKTDYVRYNTLHQTKEKREKELNIMIENNDIEELKEKDNKYKQILKLINKIMNKPMTESNKQIIKKILSPIIYFEELEKLQNLESKVDFSKGGNLILHTEKEGDIIFGKANPTYNEIKDINGIKKDKNVLIIQHHGKEFILINKDATKILKNNGKKICNTKQYEACIDTISSFYRETMENIGEETFANLLLASPLGHAKKIGGGILSKGKIERIDAYNGRSFISSYGENSALVKNTIKTPIDNGDFFGVIFIK